MVDTSSVLTPAERLTEDMATELVEKAGLVVFRWSAPTMRDFVTGMLSPDSRSKAIIADLRRLERPDPHSIEAIDAVLRTFLAQHLGFKIPPEFNVHPKGGETIETERA
ncbi:MULTISPECIES: hypothetical protein [Nocardia]|uniref:hypothetical protein n=1 Tax=Nocardia TaxID=1817 RepID=UPI000D6893F8|nr:MULTISPECIES: hypothetical protein [Nocardia]